MSENKTNQDEYHNNAHTRIIPWYQKNKWEIIYKSETSSEWCCYEIDVKGIHDGFVIGKIKNKEKYAIPVSNIVQMKAVNKIINKEQYEENNDKIKELIHIIRDESRPEEGHTDIDAYYSCWEELENLIKEI